MIRKLSSVKTPAKICVAQIEIDNSSLNANNARISSAIERAQAENADFIAIGGESSRYEDDFVIIITSNAFYGKESYKDRLSALSDQAKNAHKPLFYVAATGVHDAGKSLRVFDGGSCAFSSSGELVHIAPRFGESFFSLSLPLAISPESLSIPSDSFNTTAEAILYGTRTFLQRLNLSRIVVGISGGIDSAVTAALYSAILPPENILLVAMPGPFTSRTTRSLSHELARNLGTRFAEIPIGESVDLTCRQFSELLSQGPGGGVSGAWELSPFAIENVQARDRGSRILSAAAAAFNAVISCNANKDEITIGYGTLYGDIIGWLSAIGDLWKGEVYALGHYLNDHIFHREVIPSEIFKIKPSAELSNAQSVEKGLGDPLNYPYHDALFRAWVEKDLTPEACLEGYLNGSLDAQLGLPRDRVEELFPNRKVFFEDVCRWWNLYKGLAVSKRLQAPPLLAVSRKAFGEFSETQSAKRITP